MNSGNFPTTRMRRNRKNNAIRNLVQENIVTVHDLVYPVFVVEGNNRREEIKSLPNQYRVSIDKLLDIAHECIELGISGIALFPMIETVKNEASMLDSFNPDGLIPRAIKALKSNYPELLVFTDIALDGYTHDGHDGVSDNGDVLNDLTVDLLIKQAICHAHSGADFVCPSDMMDGRIVKIRKALDNSGFINVGIMAYSAKYASSLYGPFRDATGAMSKLGVQGKKTYQMNPANVEEALHEVALDINEGADIVMVKPGTLYLDVLYRVRTMFKKPTAIYHVSGEYAMLKFAAQSGIIDYNRAIIETMLSFKRAGANIIWTYSAIDIAKLLNHRYNL